MPKYGAVINVVEFHECPDEIAELDLTPVDIPSFDPPEDKDQFVQKLNELSPLSPLAMSEPGDRRGKEFIKSDATSSAPENLLNNIGDMQNTAPENEPTGDPEDV
jgi:hypothetical protein